MILTGSVRTLDPVRPLAGGVVLRAGRVASFDVDPDADGVVPLPPGAVVLPAFVDPHLHLLATAAARRSVDLSAARSFDEVADLLRAAPGAGWIRAWGIDETDLAERRLPTPTEIDAWTGGRPAVLHHRTGHDRVASSAVQGREAPPLPADELRDAVVELDATLLAAGVVAVTDATHTNDAAALRLLGSFPWQVTVTAMVGADRLHGVTPGARFGAVTVAEAKVMPPTVGVDRVAEVLHAVHDAGFAAAVHAADVDEVDATLRGVVAGDRVEHAGLVLPEQVDALAAAGVVVVTQPAFVVERAAKYRSELTDVEHAWLYRVRSLLDAGVPVRASSDAPVVAPDPLRTVAAAVDRTLGVAERVDLATAFGLVCTPLHLGGPADLVILDADPFVVGPRRCRVVATIRAGAIVAGSLS